MSMLRIVLINTMQRLEERKVLRTGVTMRERSLNIYIYILKKKTALYFDSISTSYRQKLKTANFSTRNSQQNRLSRSRRKLVEAYLKTLGEDRYCFHCPIRHPSRDDVAKTRYSYLKTSDYEKCVFFCDASLNFASFGPKIKPPILNRMGKQNKRRTRFFCLFFFFQRSYGHSCIFSGRCIGHIPRINEKKKRRVSRLLVSACKINTV